MHVFQVIRILQENGDLDETQERLDDEIDSWMDKNSEENEYNDDDDDSDDDDDNFDVNDDDDDDDLCVISLLKGLFDSKLLLEHLSKVIKPSKKFSFPATYAAPGIHHQQQQSIRGVRDRCNCSNNSITRDFDFFTQLPTLEDLEGTYELLFFYSPSMDKSTGVSQQHRVMMGTMECILSDNQERELKIVLKIPMYFLEEMNGFSLSPEEFVQGIHLTCTNDGSVSFALKPDDDILACGKGSIRCIQNQRALPYLPEYYRRPSTIRDQQQQTLQEDYAKLIQTKLAKTEHAETVLHEYRETYFGPIQWLCHHLQVPSDVSTLIHSFAFSGLPPPPPILLIEPNDVCLNFMFDNSESVSIIGRKTHSD